MKALVKFKKGVGFVELREVPRPSVAQNEVLIRVRAVGICGTDIHIYHDEYPYYPPVTLGHEFSGEVVEVGEEVCGWKPGDRVVAEPHTRACGVCRYCRTGNPQICPHKRSIGWGIDGAFAEYLAMPAWLLHRIPDNVSFEEAALTEPTAIVTSAVNVATGVEVGDIVVVLGAGPIGLLAAQVAKVSGACWVMITGAARDSEVRLPVAKELGIDYVLNIAEEDPVQKVMAITSGHGADLVVDASGAQSAINQAVAMVCTLGKICAIGLAGKEEIAFTWNKAVFKSCRIQFSLSSSYRGWEQALWLIASGKVRVDRLITHRLSLEDWSLGFEAAASGEAIKVLLMP
jgi:L-iditol 2-dehydrogenase